MTVASWRLPALGPQLGAHSLERILGVAAVLLLGSSTIAILVQRFETALVIAVLLVVVAGAVLLLWPDAATVIVAFLLYTNLPAIAARRGVPLLLTSSFILLLGFPLIKHLVARRARVRMDTAFDLMLVFLVVLLFSSLGARNPAAAVQRVVEFVLEGFVLYWLVINAVRGLPTLRRVVWALLAVGGLLGALTAYQQVTHSRNEFGGLAQRNYEYQELLAQADDPGVRELLRTFKGDERTSRPLGPVAQPNRFAQILLVLLPLAVFMYRSSRSAVAKLCAFMGGAFTLAGVALTQSRGAFLNLILLTIAMMAVRWARPSRVLIGAVLLFGAASVVTPTLLTRFQTIGNAASLLTDDPLSHDKADAAMRGRTTVMLAALHIFLDHPFLGVGPGQYKHHVLEYSNDNPGIQFRQLETTRRAHSLYLEMAADVGLLGLVTFLAIVLHLVRRLWRARQFWSRRDPVSADLATAFCLSLGAYLGTGLFEHLSFQRYYWFLLALAGAALHVLSAPSCDATAIGDDVDRAGVAPPRLRAAPVLAARR